MRGRYRSQSASLADSDFPVAATVLPADASFSAVVSFVTSALSRSNGRTCKHRAFVSSVMHTVLEFQAEFGILAIFYFKKC